MSVPTTSTSSAITSPSGDDNKLPLIIVISIGGVIILASIIIIIAVVIFVRKSTRELKQQTAANQNRPRGPRSAHPNSVRAAQGQRAEVIRVEPEGQVSQKQDQQNTENEKRGPDEIQGFYAVIPRSADLGTSSEGQDDPAEKGIVYAALEFDDVTGKPGKLSVDTGPHRLTGGPSVVVPSSQPDTYVEMEPLVASIRNDSVSAECFQTGGVYALARDPDVQVHAASTGAGISSEHGNANLNQNKAASAKSTEALRQTAV